MGRIIVTALSIFLSLSEAYISFQHVHCSSSISRSSRWRRDGTAVTYLPIPCRRYRRQRCEDVASFSLNAETPPGDGGQVEGYSDDASLFASLRRRRSELREKAETILNRWKDAECHSSIRLELDDWVRRLDVGKWPFVALGSAKGSVYVADLNEREVVASTTEVHQAAGGDPDALTLLHGNYDGGGTLAITMRGETIVSAGREGGAKAWNVDVVEKKLSSLGEVTSLRGVLVTSLILDGDEKLWAGCFDGTLHMFDCGDGQVSRSVTVRVGTPVLGLAVGEEIGLIAASTAKGSVELFSSENGELLASWRPPFGSGGGVSSAVHARSVAIVPGPGDKDWCVVAGGGDGTLHLRMIRLDATGVVDHDEPFKDDEDTIGVELKPSHSGPVVTLASRAGGLLISGAHDGSIRVWDCWNGTSSSAPSVERCTGTTPRCLYHLVGYKVWLGSVCTDTEGVRLVSDGADNTIVVHDFSPPLDFDVEKL